MRKHHNSWKAFLNEQKHIEEAAKSFQDLQKGMWVELLYENNGNIITLRLKGPDKTYGQITCANSGYFSSVNKAFELDCGDAYIVTNSKAEKGWGPFLYDLAMELASLYGGGLMADRDQVSSDAYRVWQKYLNRSDVRNRQLDNEDGDLGLDRKDRCYQDSADEIDDDLEGSPLSKVYTKEPPTLYQMLKRARKIKEVK